MSRLRTLLASLSNSAAASIGAAASLALTVYVAHRLGVRVLGEYAIIATVSSVFEVVDSARTQDLTTRYASGAGNEPRRLRLSIAGAGLLVATGGALLYGSLTEARAAEGAIVAWTGAVLQIMTAEAVAATQVQRRFQRLALSSAAGSVIGSALAAVLLVRFGLLALGIGLFTSAVVSRLILLSDACVREQSRRHPEPGEVVQSQTASLTFLAGVAQLLNVSDALSIRALSTAGQVGLYRAGSQIPTVLVGLIYRGFDIVMPQLAAAEEADAARLIRRNAPGLGAVVGVAGGALIGLRHPLIDLVLGHSNTDAETVLWLFTAVWMVNSVVHPAGLLLIARRRQRSIVRLVGLEYVANLAATIVLVSADGAVGSAIATLSTLAVSNLGVMPLILRRELPALPIARHLMFDCLLPMVVAAGVGIAVTAIAIAI